MVIFWSEVQILAYGSADATATPSSILQQNLERFILLVVPDKVSKEIHL